MSKCSSIANCQSEPIETCTSLPKTATAGFEKECRDLAETMCKAVVRSIEEYYRQQPASSKPSLPGGLLKWMEWANTPQSGAKPGLPDCLDLTTAPPPATIGQAMLVDESTVSNANQVSVRNYLIRTYEGVIQLGSDATVFDIDDWHDW